MVDSITYYKNEKVANDMSADGDWNRRALYMGPEVRFPNESALMRAYVSGE